MKNGMDYKMDGYDWDPNYDLHDEEVDEEMVPLNDPNRWGEVRHHLTEAFADSVFNEDHERLLRVTEVIDVLLNNQGIELGNAEGLVNRDDIVWTMRLNYNDVIDWFLERGYPLHDMIYLAVRNDMVDYAYRLLDRVDARQRHQLLNLLLGQFARILNVMYYGVEAENDRVLTFLVENGADPNTVPDEIIADMQPRYVAFFQQWKNGTLPVLQRRNALAAESGALLGAELGNVVGEYVVKPMGFRSRTLARTYLKKLHDLGFNVNLNGDERYASKIRRAISRANRL